MVVTSDEQIADRVRLLRSHGMTTLTWQRHTGHASSYDVVDAGFNYRHGRASLGPRGHPALATARRQRGSPGTRSALSRACWMASPE